MTSFSKRTQPQIEHRVPISFVPAGETVENAVSQFLEFRKLRNLSHNTITRYTHDLKLWQDWRKSKELSPYLVDVTVEELRAYFSYLQREHIPYSTNPYRQTQQQPGLKPETIAGHWKILHAAWVFWTEEDLLTERQVAIFARGRVPSPKITRQIRPTYDVDLVEQLLNADGPKPRPESVARDRLIILMLYETGMRVSELCGLQDTDLNLEEMQALITGKGGDQRFIFWTKRTHKALLEYLAIRKGAMGGPLLRALGTGGRAKKTAGKALGRGVIRDVLERRANRAGRGLPQSAVHALRHTFAHRFLDNGGDGLHLQQLLGHKSIVTTMRYVQENPKRLRTVYQRIMADNS
jgi:site-specific recombinase XerD